MGVENVHQSLMLSSFENYRVEYKFDLIHNITSITNPAPILCTVILRKDPLHLKHLYIKIRWLMNPDTWTYWRMSRHSMEPLNGHRFQGSIDTWCYRGPSGQPNPSPFKIHGISPVLFILIYNQYTLTQDFDLTNINLFNSMTHLCVCKLRQHLFR